MSGNDEQGRFSFVSGEQGIEKLVLKGYTMYIHFDFLFNSFKLL